MEIGIVLDRYIEAIMSTEQEEVAGLTFSPELMERCRQDVAQFVEKAKALVGPADWLRAAVDFWLTRNGHGAGFWDGDWDEAQGEALTEIAQSFGECEIYAGDDSLVYAV